MFAGGKRFRPALVFAVGKTFNAPSERLLRTAAAIEMIHTYSLIHDDLPSMDNDDLRRGRETSHKKFDEATAILAGDALQSLAFQAISEDENLGADLRLRLVSEIARAAGTPRGMVAGQQLDLVATGKKIALEDLEKIHQNKTGALIVVSARAGALIGDATNDEIETITNFAEQLGLLFQITDDLLDATSSTETLGKTAGKDSNSQKSTYVSLTGIERAREFASHSHSRALANLERLPRDTSLLKDFVVSASERKS